MEIVLKGEPTEIAALVLGMQERQWEEPKFVPETAEGPCYGTEKVCATASGSSSQIPSCRDTSTNY